MDTEEAVRILDAAREDMTTAAKYHAGTMEDVMHTIVRAHQSGGFYDYTYYDGPGETPFSGDFIKRCSYVNLAKLLLLQKINVPVFNAYVSTMSGRMANKSVNRLLGDELTELLEFAVEHAMSTAEVERSLRVHAEDPSRFHGRRCTRYARPGDCGSNCRHFHLEDEATFNS